MNYEIKELRVPSVDGIHKLAGKLYLPEGDPVGLLHVVHGMTEYIGRYDDFMREAASRGWLCFGYDHLGHGYTVNDDSELGFIAKKDGWDLLCRDVAGFYSAVKAEYPQYAQLPYSLMGHSMGSFIVRLTSEKYLRPHRLIIMGTGGPNPAAGAGLALIGLIKLFYGAHHRSKLLQKVIFGGYNSKFPDNTPDCPGAWLTNDKTIRQRYAADKLCRFKFTVSAMGDLIRLMKYCNRPAWYKSLDKTLPILIVSGKDDPVGEYGKGVEKVHSGLKKQGCNVTCHLYEGGRHEILNDGCAPKVRQDIFEFIK